ncbi:MAG TPA: RsmG family class I SAM-dependent methyltransferase [Acidimicrobiales bacterium]|nr:RsmG family class I SAM-dependent methyltransferase [Acidimicrobiales bacterium]
MSATVRDVLGTMWTPSEALVAALLSAQARRAIGPAPIEDHIAHALGFLGTWPELAEADTVLDLGSGGGLPGLVLAARLPKVRFCLLEGSVERARSLEMAVRGLGWTGRVTVRGERAEDAAHRPEMRAAFPVVVARGFGPPAATAECAAGFLRSEGVLVVSGPPGGAPEQWPVGPLGGLGFELVEVTKSPRSFVILRQVRPCPGRFPRRVGVPEHRPLF